MQSFQGNQEIYVESKYNERCISQIAWATTVLFLISAPLAVTFLPPPHFHFSLALSTAFGLSALTVLTISMLIGLTHMLRDTYHTINVLNRLRRLKRVQRRNQAFGKPSLA